MALIMGLTLQSVKKKLGGGHIISLNDHLWVRGTHYIENLLTTLIPLGHCNNSLFQKQTFVVFYREKKPN